MRFKAVAGKLHYWRCDTCLTVIATKEEVKACACSGAFAYMGYVHRDPKVLLRPEIACACNTLCTDAAGPCCNCACGGINHGTGRYVEIIKEVGLPTRLGSVTQKALDQAAEYLSLLEAFPQFMRQEFGSLYDLSCNGGFIANKDTWWKITSLKKEFYRVSRFQQHKKRVTAMRAIMKPTEGKASA